MSAAPDVRNRGGPGAPRVIVAGGGVSGLAAALRLTERARQDGRDIDVLVLEASAAPGGLVRTVREDRLTLDLGPDSLLDAPPAALDLCRRVGLDGRLVDLSRDYPPPAVLHRGRVVALPRGLTAAGASRPSAALRASVLSPLGRLRALTEPFVPARGAAGAGEDEESLAAFVRRRAGREMAERIADPLVAGLFVGDPERLSAALTVPRLVAAERRAGSVSRGLRAPIDGAAAGARGGARIHALEGGMQGLTDALVAALPGDAIRTGARIEAIGPAGAGGWRVAVAESPDAVREVISCDAVVLALPATAAASALAASLPPLAGVIGEARAASCATVGLAFDRGAVRTLPPGYGFFVPRSAGHQTLACSVVSAKMPGRAPEGTVLLRCYVGGDGREAILASDDAGIVETVLRELAPVLGLMAAPRWSRVARFPGGMPQPVVGEASRRDRVRALARDLPGLSIAGGALGLVGIPACVEAAEAAADDAVRHACRRARGAA